MGDPQPTPEQRDAIVAGGSIAVRAGAGSGKTMVLAERYVHLLRPPAGGGEAPEVARLLAITFTEKAAAEMRGRIRVLVAREAGAHPDQRPHWTRVQRELLGAHISTIHAFCARVVREHPIETGVDPDARVLDAEETRRYLDARVEHHLLDLAGTEHPGALALLRRGRGLHGGGRSGGAVGMVVGLLESLGRLGRGGPWLRARSAVPPAALAESVAAIVQQLAHAVEEALADRSAKRLRPLAEGWPAWKETLRRLPEVDPEGFPAVVPVLGRLAAALAVARVGDGVLRHVNGRLQGSLAAAVASAVAWPEARAISDLVADVDDRLRADKRRDAVLTFDDLVLIARDLVVGHRAVRAALARRFDAVLLDECQDTDPAQAELLGAITAPGGPVLFVVGDEKQAIYGFRGADVAVFERLLRELPERATLGQNFRSVPSILAFVNAMGARLLETSPGSAGAPRSFGPDHTLRPHRAELTPPTGVRVVTVAREIARRGGLKAAATRELEARILAEVLHDLLHGPADPVAPGDVTVLFRSLREVKVYEHALARRGVPYHVVGGRGFFQRQEVRDVLSLLALAADPGDRVALAAVLRSPWVGVPDDTLWALVRGGRSLRAAFEAAEATDDGTRALVRLREALGALRRLRSRGSVSEVLVRAVEALDLDAVLLGQPQGEQQAANVRKVVELARAFARGAHGGVPEFVAWMRRRDASDVDEPEALLAAEDADVVRLMTIHQSKGLEFPVVVLADLGRKLRFDYDAVVVDEDAGIVAAPLIGAGGHAVVPTELVRYRTRAAERARAEHARLFYVACTRAQDRLVLIDATTNPKHLQKGGGAPEVWGHALWDVLGPERVWAAGAAAEPTVMEIGPGAHVVVEPASRWLSEAPAPWESEGDRRPAAAEPTEAAQEAVENALATIPAGAETIECTPTEIAELGVCPRRVWYQSVLGVREAGEGGRRARVLGSLVHGALERWGAGAARDADEALGPALAFRVADPGLRAELAEDVRRAIGWLEAERAGGTRLFAREVPFALALAPDVIVRGRIDAVLSCDGRAVVRDYKYARAPESVGGAHRDQLRLYAVAMSRAGYEGVRAELLFLRPVPAVRAVDVGDLEQTATVALGAARALAAARRADHADAFPRRPSAPAECRRLGCGYVRRCWLTDSGRGETARTGAA
jgi:ATP-dependent helicase/nuclease subunit A